LAAIFKSDKEFAWQVILIQSGITGSRSG